MSSNNPILESNTDFGDAELNKTYQSLDNSTQEKLKKYSKDLQIELLKNIANPELKKLYNSLSDEKRKKIDKYNIRDKYDYLKLLYKKEKLKEQPESKQRDEKVDEFVPLDMPAKEIPLYSVPPELLQEKEEFYENLKNVEIKPSQEKLDSLINTFYNTNPFIKSATGEQELEVKFGTRGVKQLTRDDYDNVIKKLKSSGFNVVGDPVGEYYLRVQCEYLDSTSGKFKLSDVRTEISGLHTIQEYCNSNDLASIYKKNPTSIKFINKKLAVIDKEVMYPLDFNDFNFRVSYNMENNIKKGIENFIISNWKKSKKEFRFINRVRFVHNLYPLYFDISITKFGNRSPDRYGRENRGPMLRVYNIDESNVFNNSENYEIEIEINNSQIGPSTKFNNPRIIANVLRKGIKMILSGLQNTNYPISYPEQKEILDSYLNLIWRDELDQNKNITSKYFIGPNSITLQLKNIAQIDENSNEPNIRKDFVVTEKADGQRHLMYISNDGKIYLINTNMEILFTGAKTTDRECFNTLLDGELILHDKNGKFINLYAAFDIYYIKKEDVRSYTFMMIDSEKDKYKCRYNLLKYVEYNLQPVSVVNNQDKIERKLSSNQNIISPITFKVKDFFPNGAKQTIFDGCNTVLQKEKEGRFEYNTDGLIFTHAFYGVGSSEIGKSGPKTKITWEYSFKWKPPQYNTIDFLVTTLKDANGNDVVKSFYEEGTNNYKSVQYSDYKVLELRCGFSENKDGFINPCQDIIDDKLPSFVQRFEDSYENDYIPMRFYPTEPYDPNAGLCNIMLRSDGSGGQKMFSEEDEVFEDNTIVEFRYDFTKNEGWRWIPLRVRHDKTSKLRRGEKEYGNAYKVCNENWKSIHPTGKITEDMLSTGLDIPSISVSEDVYYNTPSGKFKTDAMKNFHNLYVKKKLISGVSKPGDNLIDFACGKAGDLPKWIASKLSFVFGIDISKDNLENRIDGACARFLKMKKSYKNVPYALFVNGNSAYNIKDGSAMLNEKAKQITAAVFGRGSHDSEKIGRGVARQYGKGADGFNVSSCQFAIHYFFENPDTLKSFMKNITECTKHNGYFIGTCYDGKLVFNELKKVKTGDSIKIIDDGKKIWEIIKGYGSDTFDDDSSCIGYRIDVYQESINQIISEYLVNFDYLNRIMSAYGFELINREEALEFGLPDGSGLFSEMFLNMLDEISKNKFAAKNYEKAPYMTTIEKKISFLNRYFIYKKIRNVNVDNVELELGEYRETITERINKMETIEAEEIARETIKETKPKVRKLSKKLLLVAATEAIDEPQVIETTKPKKKSKKVTKPKKNDVVVPNKENIIVMLESDEEDI